MNEDERDQWGAINGLRDKISELVAETRETNAHVKHLARDSNDLKVGLEKIETRVRVVERKQTWYAGASAVVGFVIAKFASKLFG